MMILWSWLWLASPQQPAPTAHAAYHEGLRLAREEQREASAREFQVARSRGQGELRNAAIYNLGTLALQEAERWRAELPEVRKSAPAAALPLPPLPSGAGQQPGQQPDPLTEARKHYLEARRHCVERLRLDWRDGDTRAQAELVTRRLKELDEIEKQRQQQQQQDQKPQDQKDQKDPENKQDQKDPQQPDKPPEKPQEKPDPSAQDKPEESPSESAKPEESQPETPPKEPQPQPGEPSLSKEEMVQLLDRLQKLEEQAEKLKAQMREARRTAVKKDW
jgi:hypothetical protein